MSICGLIPLILPVLHKKWFNDHLIGFWILIFYTLVEHEDYIDVFCSDFDEVLRSMIDNGIELKSKQEIKDSLALETMAHAQFAQHKCAIFHGRKDFLELLKAKVADKSNRYVSHVHLFTPSNIELHYKLGGSQRWIFDISCGPFY